MVIIAVIVRAVVVRTIVARRPSSVIGHLVFRVAEYTSFLVVHTLIGVPYLLAVPLVLGSWLVVKFFYFRGVVFAAPPVSSTASGSRPE